jgi:hypothetical protein
VTVGFPAASEAWSGIAALCTQLPAGIGSADVTLASARPAGPLTPIADGFEVAGPALPSEADARYALTVAELARRWS